MVFTRKQREAKAKAPRPPRPSALQEFIARLNPDIVFDVPATVTCSVCHEGFDTIAYFALTESYDRRTGGIPREVLLQETECPSCRGRA